MKFHPDRIFFIWNSFNCNCKKLFQIGFSIWSSCCGKPIQKGFSIWTSYCRKKPIQIEFSIWASSDRIFYLNHTFNLSFLLHGQDFRKPNFTPKKTTKDTKNTKNFSEKVKCMQFFHPIWKNLHLTEFFYTGTACGVCDKYEVWSQVHFVQGSISNDRRTFEQKKAL